MILTAISPRLAISTFENMRAWTLAGHRRRFAHQGGRVIGLTSPPPAQDGVPGQRRGDRVGPAESYIEEVVLPGVDEREGHGQGIEGDERAQVLALPRPQRDRD